MLRGYYGKPTICRQFYVFLMKYAFVCVKMKKMRLFWHFFILWFAFYQRYLKYFSSFIQLNVKCA